MHWRLDVAFVWRAVLLRADDHIKAVMPLGVLALEIS